MDQEHEAVIGSPVDPPEEPQVGCLPPLLLLAAVVGIGVSLWQTRWLFALGLLLLLPSILFANDTNSIDPEKRKAARASLKWAVVPLVIIGLAGYRMHNEAVPADASASTAVTTAETPPTTARPTTTAAPTTAAEPTTVSTTVPATVATTSAPPVTVATTAAQYEGTWRLLARGECASAGQFGEAFDTAYCMQLANRIGPAVERIWDDCHADDSPYQGESEQRRCFFLGLVLAAG